MTKVSVLVEAKEKIKVKSEIQFVKYLDEEGCFGDSLAIPSDYDNVILLRKGYTGVSYGSYDLIYAYDENNLDGTLYIGYWNDGIV